MFLSPEVFLIPWLSSSSFLALTLSRSLYSCLQGGRTRDRERDLDVQKERKINMHWWRRIERGRIYNLSADTHAELDVNKHVSLSSERGTVSCYRCVATDAVMGLVMGTFPMQSKQVNYHTGKSISLRFMTVALIVLIFLGFLEKKCFFCIGKTCIVKGFLSVF